MPVVGWCFVLLVGGDIESSPDPMSSAQEEKPALGLSIAQFLQSGRNKILNNGKALGLRLSRTDDSISPLEKPVLFLKNYQAKPTPVSSDAHTRFEYQVISIYSQLSALNSRGVGSKARSQRNNLLLFGVPDKESENWGGSEEQMVDQFTLDQAHRLGSFKEGKNRPKITKFSSLNLKDAILCVARTFKGTPMAWSEDFPSEIRIARSNLPKFG